MPYILGIDIGTYESKGVLTNNQGKILIIESIPHKLEIPFPGGAEHDANGVWWNDFKQLSNLIIKKARNNYNIKSADISAVGVSTIGPAVVPINKEGTPLRKGILYGVDTRAEKEINLLNNSIGEEEIFKKSGQYLTSQSAGPKILWIRQNEPSIYKDTYKFLCGSGYIVFKLTKKAIIDRYTAVSYSPLFNVHDLTWDDAMASQITELKKLPKLKWSHDIVGEVTKEASHETGLKEGTKVIAGTTDALSESISVGAVHPGDLMLMYGSSTFFIHNVSSLSQTKRFWPNLHGVENRYTITGGTATAGSLTRWFVDNLMLQYMNEKDAKNLSMSDMYNLITQEAQQSPIGSNGLITLPYFSGERTPINNANAKGMIFGLTLQHTNADIYRSLVEGIAFSIRHNIEELKKLNFPIKRALIVGGGVKSNLWVQSVSDVCDIKQIIPTETIGASYGNAFLCALSLGWYTNLEDINYWVDVAHEVNPKPKNQNVLEKNYKIYRELYENNKIIMNEI